jgi:hypothetical protein
VQITYQLTPDDFYQGCIAWRNRRKWRQWLRWVAYFIVGIATLISLVVLFFAHSSQTNSIGPFGVIFGVGWFAYMLLAPRFSSRRQFRNNPTVQSQVSLDVSEQGLETHNAHADTKVAWTAFVDWGEVSSVFIVMPQPRVYIAIPKRAFNERQLEEFREILRRNVGKK